MKPARRPLLGLLAAAALLSFLLLAAPPSGLLLFPSSSRRHTPTSPYAHRPKLLFLLAGQSNMAGRGAPPVPLPPPYRPHPRLLRLAADRRWVAASPPLHADIDTHKTCGLGPAMPFAHRVLLSSSPDSAPSSVAEPSGGNGDPEPMVLGLVPCAVGGTRIWMWARGQPLYEAAVARTRAAVADGGGALGAVLWFQGESDTIEADDARSYGGKMERLVADLRADLGLPSLLVIQVGLASGEGNYTDIVREAQQNVNLPNVIYVDAMGLPLSDDQLHLSTEAQLQLGEMLAQAYLEFDSSREPKL